MSQSPMRTALQTHPLGVCLVVAVVTVVASMGACADGGAVATTGPGGSAGIGAGGSAGAAGGQGGVGGSAGSGGLPACSGFAQVPVFGCLVPPTPFADPNNVAPLNVAGTIVSAVQTSVSSPCMNFGEALTVSYATASTMVMEIAIEDGNAALWTVSLQLPGLDATDVSSGDQVLLSASSSAMSVYRPMPRVIRLERNGAIVAAVGQDDSPVPFTHIDVCMVDGLPCRNIYHTMAVQVEGDTAEIPVGTSAVVGSLLITNAQSYTTEDVEGGCDDPGLDLVGVAAAP